MRTNKIKNELDETKKQEGKIKQRDLIYEAKKYLYNFQPYEMIRSFGDSIYTCKAKIVET